MRAEREPVEVRSSFRDGHWSSGFEVAGRVQRRHEQFVRLRRQSDGAILPALFRSEDVRAARR